MRTAPLLLPILALSIALGSSGCASMRKKEKETKEKPAPVAPQPVFVGTISLVNEESKFVLIDAGLLQPPPSDLALRSFTRDHESAELVTSQVRRRPFVIADIKSGAPLKGDRVYTAVGKGTQRSPIPSSASIGTRPAMNSTEPPPADFLPQVQLAPTP